MRFSVLIVKNLVRQRVRTALTVVGISVGITIVVALGAITGGMKETAGSILRSGGADMLVGQKGSADFSFSTVSEQDAAALAARGDVARAVGVLWHIAHVGTNPFFVVVGIEPAQTRVLYPTLVSGRYARAAGEAIAGTRAGVREGGTLRIGDRPFRIVGVYASEDVWSSSGAVAPLASVQALARKPGVLTGVYLYLREGADARAVGAAIEDEHPELVALREASDYGKVDQGMQIMDAANLAISLLAVVIGAIGVMNTMIMSVFERTREIGILRAVGWPGSRILRMIVAEALLLCVVSAVVGTAFGVLATRALMLVQTISNFLEPRYSADVFVRALVVAVTVSLVGALYPALRAARLRPLEALRYE